MEKIPVEIAILQGAVQLVRAALHDGDDHAAADPPEFGGQTGGEDPDLLDGVHGREDRLGVMGGGAADRLLGADAVHRVTHRAVPLADGVVGEEFGRIDPGKVSQNIERAALHHGDSHKDLVLQCRRRRGRLRLEQGDRPGNGYGFGDRPEFELDIDAREIARPELDVRTEIAGEARRLDAEFVGAGRQVWDEIAAGLVGEALGGEPGSGVHDRDLGAGDHRAGRVGHHARQSGGASVLASCREGEK